MKALDKIIVVQYEDGELSEYWCKENRTDSISVEYIRKDALLEWLEDMKFMANSERAEVYQNVIDKLNKM